MSCQLEKGVERNLNAADVGIVCQQIGQPQGKMWTSRFPRDRCSELYLERELVNLVDEGKLHPVVCMQEENS